MTTPQDFTPGADELGKKLGTRTRTIMGHTGIWMLGIDVVLILVFGFI